ncbi:MAG: T9SS type A sorting domain-containing protein [Candidatus Eisenbacteria bacterium]
MKPIEGFAMPSRLAAFLFLLAVATAAEARVDPNPEGRLVRSPEGGIVQLGRFRPLSASRPRTLASPVPLPAGAVPLDSTYYDLQDMGSLGNRIVIGADGRVHLTYQKDFCEIGGGCPPNLNLPQPYPQRGMAYTFRDAGGTWQHLGKVADPVLSSRRCCALPEEFGGFGTIDLAPSGAVAISQHINEESCDLRGQFFLENAPGGSVWTAKLPPFATGDSYLFPQVVANPNGSFLVLGEVPIGGSYAETQRFGVSYFPNAGGIYTCFNFQGQAWKSIDNPSLYRDGRPAFPSLAVSPGGRAGVAVTDFGGNVFLIESANGTFGTGTVTIRQLTSHTDAAIVSGDSTSTEWRPFVHCHLAYNDTTAHVVWSELQARRVGGQVLYFDWRSRIRHWDPVSGLSTVKQVQAGEADRFDDVDNDLSGPLCGFNTISVDWPQVGFSEDGSETYVVWLRASDAEVDPTADMQLPGIVTGVAFMDIAASLRAGAGSWLAGQNLTNTPATDERFVSIAARNAGGAAHVVFQASVTDQAGCIQIGDRGTSPGNILRRIAYLERPLAASSVEVPAGAAEAPGARLSVWPNPARGGVSFQAPDPGSHEAIEIFDVHGRRIASISLDDRKEAVWNGRDVAGRAVQSGIYLARRTSDLRAAAKFLLLQ